ncbi:MAG TPA: type II toxin-antitoxin system RelE/ParE family toxin [Hyphomicrobiales bacterium]|nr:type II toxin-antitoxin system RelE/ParE family toxin [Hyphomicrobiales bacterium]
MTSEWSDLALADLDRLYAFLAAVNPGAADRIVQALAVAPRRLLDYPRLGERLEQFEAREVRRIFVGNYEMRYEIVGETITILRIWHARERR